MADIGGQKVVLYYTYLCPFATRAWLAIAEKGIAWEPFWIDLSNKDPKFVELYATIHPDPAASAKVPMLQHFAADGSEITRITESPVVSEYLDDAFPSSGTKLVPASAVDKANMRFFQELAGPVVGAFYKIAGAKTAEEAEAAATNLLNQFKILDKYLKEKAKAGGDYLLGADYSLAEILSAPFVIRMHLILPVVVDFDLVAKLNEIGADRAAAWVSSILTRPSTVDLILGKPEVAEEVKTAQLKRFSYVPEAAKAAL